jgi:hypothetical protein
MQEGMRMSTAERAARSSDERPKSKARQPIRTGKFLKLLHLSYGGTPDPKSGELMYTGRVGLGVLPVRREFRADERTTDGAVTAIDLALRAAIVKMRRELPALQLWPYHVTLSSRTRGIASAVRVQAKIRLDGLNYRARVRHPDTVTAAAFLLFDAYDHILYERWRELLRMGNVTPEDAFQAMMDASEEAEEEYRA